jgi:hypothetical protein
MKEIKFKYYINHSGEKDAGIYPYSDIVTVEIDSGELGGEMQEEMFREAMEEFLEQWFDGAHVTYN